MIRYLLILILLAPSVFAQDGARIHRHKFYDTTRVEGFQKIKRRRLTADVDSTGIAMRGWGNETYFKVNLLGRMAINRTFFRKSTVNGFPAVTYGNARFRFRMFVTKQRAFEFDAIIRSKPLNGRHTIPFSIQRKGLDFFYQPALTAQEIADGAFRPDSVVGSYAVYHSSKWNNRIVINGKDTTREYYGTGKAFHVFRPKAWDSSLPPDTVWGTINIDTLANIMRIGVDSTWLTNATFPVRIDPQFGYTGNGASNQLISANYQLNAQYTSGSDAAGAAIDSIAFYVNEDATTAKVGGALYADDGSNGCGSFVDSSKNNATTTTANSTKWYQIAMSATNTLSASTKYWLGYLTDNSNNLRYDSGTGTNWERQFNRPWPPDSPCGNHTWLGSTAKFSIYITYTVSGGGPTPTIGNYRHGPLKTQRHGPAGQTVIHTP